MTEEMRFRLDILRRERATGMDALAELQRKQDDLRATLLRISGAIQVLEELLRDAAEPPQAP